MRTRLPLQIAVLGNAQDPYIASLRSDDYATFHVVSPSELQASKDRLQTVEAALLWEIPPSSLAELFALCPALKWAHAKSAGVENLPLSLFREHNITLTNAAGVFAESLAEFVVAGLLYFLKDIPLLRRQQQTRSWKPYEVLELRGSTALIVGYGGIGRAIAERLAALKVNVIACRNRTELQDPFVTKTIAPASIAAHLPTVDHLILSAPLTSETRGMIGPREVAALKESSIVVNVGRGPLIDEAALLNALRTNQILGAALDVFDEEPLPERHPFWDLENVLISPHTADRTAGWLWDALAGFQGLLERRVSGLPLTNIVDIDRGY